MAARLLQFLQVRLVFAESSLAAENRLFQRSGERVKCASAATKPAFVCQNLGSCSAGWRSEPACVEGVASPYQSRQRRGLTAQLATQREWQPNTSKHDARLSGSLKDARGGGQARVLSGRRQPRLTRQAIRKISLSSLLARGAPNKGWRRGDDLERGPCSKLEPWLEARAEGSKSLTGARLYRI
jgi:hypothetical protein